MRVQKERFSVPRRWNEARNGVAERSGNYVSNYNVSEGNNLRKHILIRLNFIIDADDAARHPSSSKADFLNNLFQYKRLSG